MGHVLNEQELHNLAMNLVGRELEQSGFEFMAVNSKIGKNPQFVCIKEKQLHFIVVRYVLYPNDPTVYDMGLMQKIARHAEKYEAKAYYAGVGLSNATNPVEPVFLNEPYQVSYHGLIEI
jgi:hypothetical protein